MMLHCDGLLIPGISCFCFSHCWSTLLGGYSRHTGQEWLWSLSCEMPVWWWFWNTWSVKSHVAHFNAKEPAIQVDYYRGVSDLFIVGT